VPFSTIFWSRYQLRHLLVTGFLFGLVVMLAGCSTATVAPTAVPSPTIAATATDTPTLTPEPTATPTPAPLTPSQVFRKVSPSVAFIDTPVTRGSGFLIDGGYVVTSAHVVWPFDTVRVVFPDGSEFKNAPLLAWDLMVDLAVIGPIGIDLPPLTPIDGENYVIGSDVYLIGYPGEVEEFPQPAISRGLISRKREWDRTDVTYFQTDAAVAGGQSGGVLVSELGEAHGQEVGPVVEEELLVADTQQTRHQRVQVLEGRERHRLYLTCTLYDT